MQVGYSDQDQARPRTAGFAFEMPLLLVACICVTSISQRKRIVGLFVLSSVLVCCLCCFLGDGDSLLCYDYRTGSPQAEFGDQTENHHQIHKIKRGLRLVDVGMEIKEDGVFVRDRDWKGVAEKP